MVIVDSSVWIDALNGKETSQTAVLRLLIEQKLIGQKALVMGDLVLTEILQGLVSERDFNRVLNAMRTLPVIQISDQTIAIQAARNYRKLRAMGITVRKTIDNLIATRCIIDGHSLLYSDGDFDPFVTHLGLATAMAE